MVEQASKKSQEAQKIKKTTTSKKSELKRGASVKAKKEEKLHELDVIELERMLRGSQVDDEAEEEETPGESKKRYYQAKAMVLELEKKNVSQLILFESIGNVRSEWYKMGGNSALIYKYFIGPRLGKRGKIRPDTERRCRFYDGILSVHWRDQFLAGMKELGYTDYRENVELGIIIYDLGKSWSLKELGEWRKKEREEWEKLNVILKPKRALPELYSMILKLVKLIPPRIPKLPKRQQKVMGERLMKKLTDLYTLYLKMANGRMALEKAKQEMLETVDEMSAILLIIKEDAMWGTTHCLRIGEVLADTKEIVEKQLKETKQEGKKREKEEQEVKGEKK